MISLKLQEEKSTRIDSIPLPRKVTSQFKKKTSFVSWSQKNYEPKDAYLKRCIREANKIIKEKKYASVSLVDENDYGWCCFWKNGEWLITPEELEIW